MAERSNGAEMIAAERQRQIDAEGWTPEHDAGHTDGQLTTAAESYLWAGQVATGYAAAHRRTGIHYDPMLSVGRPPISWPWAPEFWKPSDDPVRNLVKAGALIAAEIDRLTRTEGAEHG